MQMRTIVAGIALALLPSIGMAADNGGWTAMESNKSFETGNTYLQLPELAQLAYVEGVIDGFGFMAFIQSADLLLTRMNACTDHMAAGQAKAIVDLYLKSHPEEWDNSMDTTVFGALKDACIKRGHPLFNKQ